MNRRLLAIEPMTALNLLIVGELIHNAEWSDQNLITFLYHRFFPGAWDISTCHGRNLYRTIKNTSHFQQILTIRFRIIYQWCFNDSYFSRYNDSSPCGILFDRTEQLADRSDRWRIRSQSCNSDRSWGLGNVRISTTKPHSGTKLMKFRAQNGWGIDR